MFKKLFCRHKLIYIAHNRSYSSRLHLWQCKKCGKYIIYDKFDNKYGEERCVNWAEWERVGDPNEKQ